ncbi:MAG: hypothetical protein H7320_08455 [Ferruginibacter sp.]|nr:hypothetical protein [Ferruginibacter sp.]
MEPDVTAFLLRIVQTISMAIVWLLINMSVGIYFGFAFFDDAPSLGNYVFYVWFIASFVLLILYLKKKWKGWKEIGE